MRAYFDDVTLNGDGFKLRPLLPMDIPAITEACQDEMTQRWLPLPHPYSQETARQFVEEIAPAALSSGHGIVRAIAGDGHLHGVIDCKLTHWRSAETEIGYWVAPWGRGSGIAGRAARLLSEWALREQDIERVTIYAAAGNIASQKSASAAGFVREGVKRSGGFIHGGRTDLVLFGKIRADLS